jgi:hypothetical protein
MGILNKNLPPPPAPIEPPPMPTSTFDRADGYPRGDGYPTFRQQFDRLQELVACISPTFRYVHLPTGEAWEAHSVEAYVGKVRYQLGRSVFAMNATEWLERYRAVLNGRPLPQRHDPT